MKKKNCSESHQTSYVDMLTCRIEGKIYSQVSKRDEKYESEKDLCFFISENICTTSHVSWSLSIAIFTVCATIY